MFTVEIRLETGQRRELVGYLSGEGMSNRAIADVTGVSEGTVRNDRKAGAQDCAREITGLDGKTYKREPQPKPDHEPLWPGACTAQRVRATYHLLDFDPEDSAAALSSPFLCGGLYPDDADQIDKLIAWLSVLRDGMRVRMRPLSDAQRAELRGAE